MPLGERKLRRPICIVCCFLCKNMPALQSQKKKKKNLEEYIQAINSIFSQKQGGSTGDPHSLL